MSLKPREGPVETAVPVHEAARVGNNPAEPERAFISAFPEPACDTLVIVGLARFSTAYGTLTA